MGRKARKIKGHPGFVEVLGRLKELSGHGMAEDLRRDPRQERPALRPGSEEDPEDADLGPGRVSSRSSSCFSTSRRGFFFPSPVRIWKGIPVPRESSEKS